MSELRVTKEAWRDEDDNQVCVRDWLHVGLKSGDRLSVQLLELPAGYTPNRAKVRINEKSDLFLQPEDIGLHWDGGTTVLELTSEEAGKLHDVLAGLPSRVTGVTGGEIYSLLHRKVFPDRYVT
jgi:hypothetical protein